MSNKTEKLSLRLTPEQVKILEALMLIYRQKSKAGVIDILIEDEAKRRNITK